MRPLRLPYSEFVFSFARSSGPGGQNVNKVNTKAVLRWNLWNTSGLSSEEKTRVAHRLARRINDEGELVISSDEHRDQRRNKEECINRLYQLLEGARQIPKVRKKTRPTASSRARTIQAKRSQSEKKRLRRRPFED